MTTCPSNSFLVTTNSSCTACLSPCATCIGTNTNCTSCLASFNGTTWFYLNNVCFNICPSTYYQSLTNNDCLKCNTSCLDCTATQCLSCNSPFLLYGGLCYSSCPTGSYIGNATNCIGCPTTCTGCVSSTNCTACITGYSFYNQTDSCLSSCPSGFYSDGSNCLTCPTSPSVCLVCSYVNQQPACITCTAGSLIQEYVCVTSCTIGSASGQYCVSNSCSQLANCLVCSGTRCLQCSSLYTLSSTFTCTQNAHANAVLSALAEVPVPFPFLIVTIMVIILSFFLRYNYPKMFAPLFIYSLAGCLEELCLVLWATLSLLWNANVKYPLPLVSVAYGPVLILIAYGLLNIVQLVLWKCIIANDRKYKLW